MRSKITYLALALKAGITLLLLGAIGLKIDWGAVLESLYSVDLGWLLLAYISLALCTLIGAYRWKVLLDVHDTKLPLGRLIFHSYVAVFFNAFLVGSTGGDAVRIFLVTRDVRSSKFRVGFSVLVDRFVGIVALLFSASLVLSVSSGVIDPRLKDIFWIGVASVIFLVLSLLLLFLLPQRHSDHFFSCEAGNRVISIILNILKAILAHRTHPLALLWSFVLSLIIVLMTVATGIALANALGITMGWQACLVIIPLALIISSVPLSIGGFGLRETAFVGLFSIYGIGGAHGPENAIVYSLFWYLVSLLVSAFGGLFLLVAPIKYSEAKDIH